MGPNLLAQPVPKELPSTGRELEAEIAQKAIREEYLSEMRVYEQEASRIFRERGSKAHEHFVKAAQRKRLFQSKQKRSKREQLVHKLLFQDNIDPFRSHRGRAILFQFDYNVDLYSEPNTAVYNFEELKRIRPGRYNLVEDSMMQQTKKRVRQLKKEGKTKQEIAAIFQYGDIAADSPEPDKERESKKKAKTNGRWGVILPVKK